MYVLVRTDGKYVAMPGSEHSYTERLEEARIFPTREQADKDRCVENETCVAVAALLKGNR